MSDKEFLPSGFILPDGTRTRKILSSGSDWQILKTSSDTYALIVFPSLHQKWLNDELIGEKFFVPINNVFVLTCKRDYLISSMKFGPYPKNNIEARVFAITLREMRKSAKKNIFS